MMEGKFVYDLLSKNQLSRSNYCTEILLLKLLPPTNAGQNWYGLILSTLQHCVLSGLLMGSNLMASIFRNVSA
jgi:hypothetical protein